MNLRCPNEECGSLLVRQFNAIPGAQVEVYCEKCRLRVLVTKRPEYVVGQRPSDTRKEKGDLTKAESRR